MVSSTLPTTCPSRATSAVSARSTIVSSRWRAGEMSEAEFTAFLARIFSLLARYSLDGALHFICMDWRHMSEVLTPVGKSIPSSRTSACGSRTTPEWAPSIAAAMNSFWFTSTAVRRTATISCSANSVAIAPTCGRIRVLARSLRRANCWRCIRREARADGRRRHTGLHRPRRHCARQISRQRDHGDRRGAYGAALLSGSSSTRFTSTPSFVVGRRLLAMKPAMLRLADRSRKSKLSWRKRNAGQERRRLRSRVRKATAANEVQAGPIRKCWGSSSWF